MSQPNNVDIEEINRLLARFQARVGELTSTNILLEHQAESLARRLKEVTDELEALKAESADVKEPATASDFV